MKTVPAQEIKRRGISALDELLEQGPVHVVRHNRSMYVVLRTEDYERLVARPNVWDLIDRPARSIRSKEAIDAQFCAERDGWGAA